MGVTPFYWGLVFHYVTYEGEAKIDETTDPLLKQALLDQVASYGQTPTQLFTVPHPKRGRRKVDRNSREKEGRRKRERERGEGRGRN